MSASKNPETIKYWIEISEYDLETAKAMLLTGRYLYVGFMCHQCIDKALKAVFVMNVETTPPYSHDLDLLAEKSLIMQDLSGEQIAFIKELNPLNINSRYPKDKSDLFKILTKEKCSDILCKTERLFQWLRMKL